MKYIFQAIDTSTLRKEIQEQDGNESTEIRMRGGAGGVGLTDLAIRLATRLKPFKLCITAGRPIQLLAIA